MPGGQTISTGSPLKGSDIIAEFLAQYVDRVFGLQGGAVAHIFDSCERLGPKPLYCHHEQAAAFAASGYARIKGFGVCIVTTGPGATNAITPCLGAWQDSIPMLFISGQTRVAHMSYGTGKRQVGSQEAPIIDFVKPITNYCGVVDDIKFLKPMLAAALYYATDERKGPSWLDIPVDISWSSL